MKYRPYLNSKVGLKSLLYLKTQPALSIPMEKDNKTKLYWNLNFNK